MAQVCSFLCQVVCLLFRCFIANTHRITTNIVVLKNGSAGLCETRAAVHSTSGEESHCGFGGGGGEQWQLRWYITIHFFPFYDDNDGQMMATMDDGDKGR